MRNANSKLLLFGILYPIASFMLLFASIDLLSVARIPKLGHAWWFGVFIPLGVIGSLLLFRLNHRIASWPAMIATSVWVLCIAWFQVTLIVAAWASI